jgi:hypothetical protein
MSPDTRKPTASIVANVLDKRIVVLLDFARKSSRRLISGSSQSRLNRLSTSQMLAMYPYSWTAPLVFVASATARGEAVVDSPKSTNQFRDFEKPCRFIWRGTQGARSGQRPAAWRPASVVEFLLNTLQAVLAKYTTDEPRSLTSYSAI